jgi:uncharacterized membrane-anchored protein
MRTTGCVLLLMSSLVLPVHTAGAQDDADSAAYRAYADSMAKMAERLTWQRGRIVLRDSIATLDVRDGFRYLSPEHAEWVLEDAWGNPDGSGTLGMLFPEGVGPTADESWGVVITFDEDGYVEDDDAVTLDFAKLLKEMQDDTRHANEERVKAGYESIELVGWAAPPRYDSLTNKLYWAKELRFGDADENTLNYNIRVLGRRGVLVLNAVGSMGQLAPIDSSMRDVLAFVEFNPGHRYADFDPNVDKVAVYGVGALVAGKLAAKAGLFKVLLGAIVAGKKFVLLALVAIAAFLRKVFSRKPAATPTTP